MGNSSPQEIQDFLQLSYQIFSQDWKITDNNHAILYYKIQSVYMSVRNRLPNYAYYGDEAFTGDSMGLEDRWRLNLIFKKHFSKVLLGQNRF